MSFSLVDVYERVLFQYSKFRFPLQQSLGFLVPELDRGFVVTGDIAFVRVSLVPS
jgi:hypothetical protein